MNIEQTIIDILNDAKVAMQSRMEEENENATGNTSRSFRVEIADGHIMLKAGGNQDGRTAPIETLETGRPPGGRWQSIRWFIYQWTIDKGIQTENDSHRWAIATTIARNICAFGTERYSDNVDIFTTPRTNAAEAIRAQLNSTIQSALMAAYKEINVKTP